MNAINEGRDQHFSSDGNLMTTTTEDFSKVAEEIKKHVRKVFHDIISTRHKYHNLAHTEGVVEAAAKIANHYKLSEQELFILDAAAWFHDIGYFTVIENHEEKGAAQAESFLREKGVDEEIITKVKNCILATRMPQQPANLLEQILCDADLFHLGTDQFITNNKAVRKEIEELTGYKIKKKIWRGQSIELLEQHHFFTDYCNQLLEEKQQENLNLLKEKMAVKKNHKEDDDLKKKL